MIRFKDWDLTAVTWKELGEVGVVCGGGFGNRIGGGGGAGGRLEKVL